MPPRHLARRGLALAVDALLAAALALALLVPFTALGLRLPAPLIALRGSDCTRLEAAPEWLARGLGDSGAYTLRHCARSLYGLPDGYELRVILSEDRAGAQRTSRMRVIPVDASAQPVPPRPGTDLLPLALLGLLSALFTARGWRTPGKRLAGLRLQPGDRPRPVLREFLRLGPLLLLASVPIWPGARQLPALGAGAVLALAAAVALALVWYYLWPFAHWTGQSRHDRIAGYRVCR